MKFSNPSIYIQPVFLVDNVSKYAIIWRSVWEVWKLAPGETLHKIVHFLIGYLLVHGQTMYLLYIDGN